VFWKPPPDDFFETRACELVAVNRENPNKKGSICYQNGIAGHPVETLADDFVAHVGPEVVDANTERGF